MDYAKYFLVLDHDGPQPLVPSLVFSCNAELRWSCESGVVPGIKHGEQNSCPLRGEKWVPCMSTL